MNPCPGLGEEDIDLKRLTPKQQIDAMYVTRCATTAYAVGAYYCGDDISSSTQLSGGGLDELAVVLQAGIPRLVLRLHLTQERDTMGHVWIVAADDWTVFPLAAVVHSPVHAPRLAHGARGRAVGLRR